MTELYRKDHRLITKRIIVRGTLILDTPTCLGTGDTDSPTDLPLLRDSLDEKYALLTGSSIAGALRNYLRERNKGYEQSDRRYDPAALLFGDLFSYEDEQNKSEKEKIKLREKDTQSPLVINDATSARPIKCELRDGVKINSITRTATDEAKYDLELLEAGTEFTLSFELLIDKEADEAVLLQGLALALSGLENAEISLGMKKRRGFGRCHVKEWQVWYFNLEDASDRMAWLTLDHSWLTNPPCTQPPAIDTSIFKAMKKAGLQLAENRDDERDRFTIHATFKLATPLLIRSGQASTNRAPDVVHLKSHRPKNQTEATDDSLESDEQNLVPILSGTSLAGVLRHRAERIVNTLHRDKDSKVTEKIVNDLFGFVEDKKSLIDSNYQNDKSKKAQASRLVVHESIIQGTTEKNELVQTRIAIDRFTGGAYHGALFSEQPVFGSGEEHLELELELRNPEDHEIGLFLLLLKDLWTEDLPVGGASSIGRGRLQGKKQP